MSNPTNQQNLNLTYDQLQDLLRTLVKEINKPNPIEEKALQEELQREERRTKLALALGEAEEISRWRRQTSCTHSKDRLTGESVPSGTGVWATGGQTHGNDTISLVCLRCGTHWHFAATPEERDFANSAGLLGFAPPPISRCLNHDEFVKRPKLREAVAV